MEKIHNAIKKQDIFIGWWMVLASGIMTAWGHGYWSYGFATYFKPLTDEFGWTRAEIASAGSLRNLEGGVSGPFGGILTDKYGPKTIHLVGVIIAGAGLCLMYFVQELWQFVFLWGIVISVGFNLGMLHALETAIVNWFVKKRGKAVAIFRLGLGFGAASVPTFMTILFMKYGWRNTGVIAGVITWVLCIPLTLLFVKSHRPEYYGLLPDGEKIGSQSPDDKSTAIEVGQDYAEKATGEVELTLRQAIKTRSFWLIGVSSMLFRLASPIISVHLIAHLIDLGIDPVLAAAVVGLYQIVRLPVGLVTGIYTDKVSTSNLKFIYALSYVMRGLGILVLIFTRDIQLVYLFDLFYGIGHGLHVGSFATIYARYFGRKSFASISGLIGQISLPISFVGPIYIGWIFDTTGSYQSAFLQCGIIALGAAVLWLFANPPKRPVVISNVDNIF